ncbi:MAG: ABC transporter ATP-binding protein [Coriobacteriia bacterium]|nr:ABC transporter ATP-binding protein [Coriobacteriia bacterium]
MADALVVAEGLGKIYGTDIKTRALEDVSFEIQAGEFAAIVGRSGSGKSTLLNLLGLLDTPTEGTLHLDGRESNSLDKVGRAAQRNRLLGFVFQYHHLLPEFTVRENILMPVLISGAVIGPDIENRVTETMSVLGLEGLGRKNANALSGGQKQRVAIGRALINRPPIVLADEPTGNLDTENTEAVYDLFRTINKEWGTTFLIVTHDQDIASMTDRLLEFRDGKLLQDVRNPYAKGSDTLEQEPVIAS